MLLQVSSSEMQQNVEIKCELVKQSHNCELCIKLWQCDPNSGEKKKKEKEKREKDSFDLVWRC